MRLAARVIAIAALVAAAVVGWGCARRLQEVAGVANQPPVVSLRSSAVGGASDATAEHVLTWSGADPDGRVDHYLVTTDIGALSHETEGWVATDERSRTLQARRVVRGAARPNASVEPEFDFFAVRAVDERGAVSKPACRAFFAENVAPEVRIIQPYPSSLLMPSVPPAFTVRWEGSDPDGPNGRPAKYKFRLFKLDSSVPWQVWLSDPDSLRRQFAPAFAGWDSVPGDSTATRLADLTVGSRYLFVITALDAEGAYTPWFDLNANMLCMVVAAAGTVGPRLTVFNSFFNYAYSTGGIGTDSARTVRVEAPADQPFTLKWFASAQPGVEIAGYRWALDIVDIEDETARRSANDLTRWSGWSLATTSATVGPFHGIRQRESHRLFVEAEDALGSRSLAIVEVAFIRPAFDKDLLILNDTRFGMDLSVPGHPDSLRPPWAGSWPSAAELDTFLFAVGGVRWRMTPPGTTSPAGVFKGYAFDTLGARSYVQGRNTWTIPLEVLGHFRHIVWMTDGWATQVPYFPADGRYYDSRDFLSTLVWMSDSHAGNALATWVQSGGKLWALGGGFGSATNFNWNNTLNDSLYVRTFSSFGPRPDLVAGRFMYDLAHWRSEFKQSRGPIQAHVSRAPFPASDEQTNSARPLLPSQMSVKSPAIDPLPPYRTPAIFYSGTTSAYLEYLSKPNSILEDKNPSARHQGEVQALDTLMVATAPQLPQEGLEPAVDRIVNPVMTYYHGADCGSVVFSGFDIWSWSRPDCVRLVDAVLTGLWGLPRTADASGPAANARK